MARIKIVDTILSAVSALVAAAKAFIKFICYLGKMKREPAGNTA